MDLSRTLHDATDEAWHARRAAYKKVLTGLDVRDPNLLSPEVQVLRDMLLRDLQERWSVGDVLGGKRKRKPGEKSTAQMDELYIMLLGFLLFASSGVLFLIDMELAAYAFGASFLIILLGIFGPFSSSNPRPKGPPVKPKYGFDWISHVGHFTDGHAHYSYINRCIKENVELIDWVYEREYGSIKRTFGLLRRDTGQYDAEMSALQQMIAREREHIARDNYRQIPMDPEKQTPIQKLIVNAEHEMYSDHKIKDPDTGMYWGFSDGFPRLSPEIEKYEIDKVRWESDKVLVWDDKRSSTQNFFRFLRKFGREA